MCNRTYESLIHATFEFIKLKKRTEDDKFPLLSISYCIAEARYRSGASETAADEMLYQFRLLTMALRCTTVDVFNTTEAELLLKILDATSCR